MIQHPTLYPTLFPEDKERLDQLYATFSKSSRKGSCVSAGTSLLVLVALIVIACSSLCLTLPGVNAMTQVILPGIVPGLGALILSIPLIAYSVRKSGEIKRERKALLDWQIQLLVFYFFRSGDLIAKDDRPLFIKKNFFVKSMYKEEMMKTVSEIKKRFPVKKDEHGREARQARALNKALDQAIKQIYKNNWD